jgi:hypothetical protein
MKRYTIYIIDSNEEEFNKFSAGYKEVRKYSFNQIEGDSLEVLLTHLIIGINDEIFSDQNWYFVCDNERKLILIK